VSSLRGPCPNLTFTVNGTSVYADASTEYREGNCTHVDEGRRVIVIGQRQSDGRVRAQRIDIKQKG
jgi:hypothetical protein